MIYLFNNNEEMIRIIPNSAIKRMYQTQTLTDENYISDRLDVEIQALNDEELSELEYMAVDDIENPQRFHYYFIVKETTEHNITSLVGVQSGIEELRKTPVYDMRPANRSPKFIADILLEGTNWQAGYTTDDVGTISTNFYYTDVFSALKKMCMAFGIEMQFFVEITTNRIGARYIEFRKRTGKSIGKRVVYGHNALKIVKEVEKTNTVTALIGRGKGVQVSETDAGNVGYGRKIGFESVEWKTSSGAPVDKPLGQEFVEIPELTLQYGIKNSNGTVRPKIGFVEFQDEESETRLIDRTYNALLELSRPQVLLETSSVYLPDTGIGDTVNVVRHDRDLRYQTRVFEITWDRLANQAVDMKLGDRLGESENKRISRISNQVSGNISTELSSTIEELVDRLTSADGKNTNWYTAYDPMTNPETMGLVRVNDNWYQPDPEYEGEFILKQWNGEMWVEILRTTGNPELVRQLEGAMAEAEVAKQAAQKAFTDAIAEAERLVTETDTVWQGKMDVYDEQVSQIETDAQSAQTKADQALRDVGISTNLAQTAKDLADTAKDNAQTAISNAQSAIGDASIALTASQNAELQVGTAISDASQALSQAQALGGQVDTLSFTVDDLNGKVDLRLTRAEVDSLVDSKGLATATYVDNQITATADGINADMTRVEGKIPQSYTEENLVLNSKEYVSNPDYLIKEYDLAKELTVGKEYTIVLEGGIGLTGSDQQFGIFFDNGGSRQGVLQALGNHIYKATFTLLQSGPDSGDKSKFRLYNLPNNTTSAVIKWIKLVEGKAKDNTYRPSMNELLMENDFTVFKGEYEITARSLSSRLTAIDSEGGRLSTAETQISQNATAIEERLTRSEIDTLVDDKGLVTATYVNNQITTTADGINSEITRVEGKIPQNYTEENLVLNSKEYVSNTAYIIKEYTLTKQLVVGKEYTIVLEGGIGLTGSDQQFGVYFDGGGSSQGTLQPLGGGIYKKTFTLLQTGANSGDKSKFRLYNLPNNTTSAVIKWIKLVEGSVTDNTHTPSMSDMLMENDFTVFKNTNDDTIEAINTELSKTAKKTDLNGMVTESVLSTKNYVTAGSMSTTLENYAQKNNVPTNNQFNNLKNSYDSMEQTIGTNGSKIAQMVMTDSLFSTKVLDSVEIGGRNYAVGTTDKMQYNQPVYQFSGNIQANTSKNIYTLADLGAKVGDTYTASIYIGNSDGFGSGLRIDTQSRTSKYVSPKTMHNFASVTFTVEEGDTEFRFFYANTSGTGAVYNIEACKFQIEKGNKRTDWNPSPLDKADQSQVTQLAGSWALTLKSGGDIKTQINATTNAIRLKADLIHLSGNSLIDDATIKSAHINTLNANKITGNTADFNTVRAGVLTANAVSATHINGDTAMFDKLFSTTLATSRLVAQGAWITDANINSLNASKINTGTLNAANVTIINLDVNSLTGNKTNFVQTAWNGISTAVKINSTGIDLLYANGIVSTKLNAGGLLFYEGGVQVALLQGMAESGNPYGYALAARTNYRVSLAYQATSTSYKSAISVRSTGAIQIGHDSASPSDVTWLTTNRILLNGSSTHAVKYTTISVFGEVCVFICNAAGNAGVAFGASELYLIRNNQATQFSSMLG